MDDGLHNVWVYGNTCAVSHVGIHRQESEEIADEESVVNQGQVRHRILEVVYGFDWRDFDWLKQLRVKIIEKICR